jgi:hypothetical protein
VDCPCGLSREIWDCQDYAILIHCRHLEMSMSGAVRLAHYCHCLCRCRFCCQEIDPLKQMMTIRWVLRLLYPLIDDGGLT